MRSRSFCCYYYRRKMFKFLFLDQMNCCSRSLLRKALASLTQANHLRLSQMCVRESSVCQRYFFWYKNMSAWNHPLPPQSFPGRNSFPFVQLTQGWHITTMHKTSPFIFFATPSPSNMPAWYPLQLDPWQLSLKYSNSATELPSDSIAQLVRAWQAICHVAGSSPSLSHIFFYFSSLF